MPDWWIVIRALHLVAMAFFIGGQLFLAAVVVPVERAAPERERLRRIARRFGTATLLAVAVLLATGSALAGHQHQWDNGTLHLKLGLVGVTTGLVVWHMRRPALRALDGVIFVASLGIVWLGVMLAH